MDLADFPLLKELDLFRTGVTGDIRNIREHDFPALESLRLPSTVIGGLSYQFQSVAEVPSFMHTIHQLLQRAPDLFEEYWLSAAFNWRLSEPKTHLIGMIGFEVHYPRFECTLFKRDHVLGGVGVHAFTLASNRARSTGWIQSQAEIVMNTKFTLRSCIVLNGILILFYTGDIISHPAKRNTVV